jgi:hypothetical protein
MSTCRRLILIAAPVLLLVSCGPNPSTSVPPSPAPSSAPAETPDNAVPSSAAAGQTDTAWGRIWDAIPAGFPRFAGATPADDASGEPASARYGVPSGDPETIAAWMQGALETATFSTVGLNGPAEDGSFVIDSVGEGSCRVQTTIAPLGDMTFVSVLYGADCPGP